MKFFINTKGRKQDRLLTYRIDDLAFDCEPLSKEVALDILINNLNLTVTGDYKIVQVWGMCPYGSWKLTDCDVPNYDEGELIVQINMEPGFSYRLNKDSVWDVFVNPRLGWVCVGIPTLQGSAVEFSRGCVAVLVGNSLKAIWLKPEKIPPGVFAK